MLLVCCFCDKVRDDAMDHVGEHPWQDLQLYTASRKPKREDTILSYTCCDECLRGDPRAFVFRVRQQWSTRSIIPPKR
jgi:hypothetical protein